MEGEREERERRQGEGKEVGLRRSVLGEWCYTTVCTCDTDNIHIHVSSLLLFSISFSPLPSSQGWLCDVESMMHATLKDILRACRIDLKKHLNKRDKWIRDWPGQVGEETEF